MMLNFSHLPLYSNVILMLFAQSLGKEQFEKLLKKSGSVPSLTLENIISNHTVLTDKDCSFKCLKQTSCAGFKYKYHTGSQSINCQLSSTVGKSKIEDHDKQGWVFFGSVQDKLEYDDNYPTTSDNSIEECKGGKALGMENGEIADDQITASSEYSSKHGASNARLNYKYLKGAWSAKDRNLEQWLQVKFQQSTVVTGVSTQGRIQHNQFVKNSTISYSNNGVEFFSYQQEFEGNNDRNSTVHHNISPPIACQFIRIHPTVWNRHISMRVELYGCPNSYY